jgi:hypothetical protein
MLFTPGGVYSSAYVKIDEDPLFNLQTFPTVSPAFFAAIRPPDPSAAAASSAIPPPTRGAFGTSAGVAPTLSVYSMSDRRQLASIPNLTELTGALDRRPGAPPTGPRGGFQLGPQGSTTDASLPLDKRVFLIPAADVLITVSSTRDELIVRKLDLMAEIERAKVPYLFITSVPPHDVQRGQLYRYPISVKSGSGSVTFKLESGPAGMWISPEGLVTWLPAPSAAPRSRVIVSARDRAGLEVYHDFTIEAR